MASINIGSDVCKIPWYTANVDIRPEVGPDIVMDLVHLGFKTGCAHEINLGNTLEHLASEDVKTGLAECRRVLSDSGVLYITIPLMDRAERCLELGQIDETRYDSIGLGEGNGANSHKSWYRTGDIEKILDECGFSSEPLDLKTFPYLVVADTSNPQVDPWQHGVKAVKK